MATIPPAAGNIDKALKLCKQKNVNSNNIKDRINRESVQSTTQKMIKYLDKINAKEFAESNGLMLYVGVFGKNEEVLVIDIPPLDKITQFTYSCDSHLDTSPLF